MLTFPLETSEGPGMFIPNLSIDSPKNCRPWPDLFEEIKKYIKDKSGEVSPKTLQGYKNMSDHLRQFEKAPEKAIVLL